VASKSKRGTLVLVLASFLAAGAFAQEAPAPDLELDFHFLKAGLSRKAVIKMLGVPTGQTESHTLFVKHHKLMWEGSGDKKFIAAFVQDKLWRWKVCSTNLLDC
jgi:hypothetical protein